MSCDPKEVEKWKALRKDLVAFKAQLNAVVSPRSFIDDTETLEYSLEFWQEHKQTIEDTLNHSIDVLQRRLAKLKATGDELDGLIQKRPIRMTVFYKWLNAYDEVRTQYFPLIYNLSGKYGKIP